MPGDDWIPGVDWIPGKPGFCGRISFSRCRRNRSEVIDIEPWIPEPVRPGSRKRRYDDGLSAFWKASADITDPLEFSESALQSLPGDIIQTHQGNFSPTYSAGSYGIPKWLMMLSGRLGNATEILGENLTFHERKRLQYRPSQPLR